MEGAAARPVAMAVTAEVARLREGVVVEVAKLGAGGVTARAPEPWLWLWYPQQLGALRHGPRLGVGLRCWGATIAASTSFGKRFCGHGLSILEKIAFTSNNS